VFNIENLKEVPQGANLVHEKNFDKIRGRKLFKEKEQFRQMVEDMQRGISEGKYRA